MHQQLLSPVARALALLHPGTPARTLWLCGGTLKKHTALSLKLLLVLRVQVGSEATDGSGSEKMPQLDVFFSK